MMDIRLAINECALDFSKSVIENHLELTPLLDHGRDTFTNARPLWHPPGARGIFGGIAIAQSVAAAQSTVSAAFRVHSLHGCFIVPGNADIPIVYHVERLRDGKSFATRTVKAVQNGKPIFTSTLSFFRMESGEKRVLRHSESMPVGVPIPDDVPDDIANAKRGHGGWPYINRRVGIINAASPNPHEKRAHQWVKACGRISSSGGPQAHLAAIAYISDSYFIGAIPSFNHISNYASPPLTEFSSPSDELSFIPPTYTKNAKPSLKKLGNLKTGSLEEIGMMVSLDHTIYFHSPGVFRADEWMLTELQSHWADSGRGLVFQKIWTKDGTLLATCIQEGLVRLSLDDDGGNRPNQTNL